MLDLRLSRPCIRISNKALMAAVGKDYYFFIKENFCSIKKHVLHFDFQVTAMQKFLTQMWKAAATSAHTFVSVC